MSLLSLPPDQYRCTVTEHTINENSAFVVNCAISMIPILAEQVRQCAIRFDAGYNAAENRISCRSDIFIRYTTTSEDAGPEVPRVFSGIIACRCKDPPAALMEMQRMHAFGEQLADSRLDLIFCWIRQRYICLLFAHSSARSALSICSRFAELCAELEQMATRVRNKEIEEAKVGGNQKRPWPSYSVKFLRSQINRIGTFAY